MNNNTSKTNRKSRKSNKRVKPVLTAGQKAANTKGEIGLLVAGSRAQITRLNRVIENLTNPADKSACTRKIQIHVSKLAVMGIAA